MKNIIDEYGKNAGKIWDILNDSGSLPMNKLLRNTKLKVDEFYSAVGWLARENKINKDDTIKDSTFGIGETNLTTKIGGDAGNVWNTLSIRGENDASDIAKYAQIELNDVLAALGWLAREDKINIKYGKNKQLKFRLKNGSPIKKTRTNKKLSKF
jgi:hypothetical protein